MIYKVIVHRDSVLFPTIGEYLVDSSSGEVAATFALSVAKRDYPEEKSLHVRSCAVVNGDFIGKATQQNMHPTTGTRRQNGKSKSGKLSVK